jgi:hypothetical protein
MIRRLGKIEHGLKQPSYETAFVYYNYYSFLGIYFLLHIPVLVKVSSCNNHK